MQTIRSLLCLAAVCFGASCAVPLRHDRNYINTELQGRTGISPRPGDDSTEVLLPRGIHLDDGLSEEEAVAIALWNNAAFREVLADLGFSRADVVSAGLLSNPVFAILFPLGPKQLEFVAKFPVESLWLRPRRIAIAQLDAEQVAERLVESGLNVVRDTRVAWADTVFASGRLGLANENVWLNGRIEELTRARLAAGEVSELEVVNAHMGSLLAQEEARRFEGEFAISRARMRTTLGLADLPREAVERTLPIVPPLREDLTALEEASLAARPDVRAAELAIEVAGERAGLAQRDFIAVAGLADANGSGKHGFETGPGLELTLPIFNWNQGGRARAEAEIQRVARRYVTVRDRILLEVASAYDRLRSARDRVALWSDRALPEMQAAVAKAQGSYAAGDTSLFLLYQTTSQELALRVRHLEAQVEAVKARAELERSVGRRVDEDLA